MKDHPIISRLARVCASDSYDIGAVVEVRSKLIVVRNGSGGTFHIPFGSIREVKPNGTVLLSRKLERTEQFRQR